MTVLKSVALFWAESLSDPLLCYLLLNESHYSFIVYYAKCKKHTFTDRNIHKSSLIKLYKTLYTDSRQKCKKFMDHYCFD